MKNVLEWLEASASRVPQNIAFADTDDSLSYADLEARAKSVGCVLAGKIAPGSAVALYLEKDISAVVGLFGVVYAGCFYSVLDVRQPRERLVRILSVLQPSLVLTNKKFCDKAAEFAGAANCELICIEDIWQAAPDLELLAHLRAASLNSDPLYVNFTSGSTGLPKGVVVAHRSVIDFIPKFIEVFKLSSDDRFANQAPFDFDVSVKDIYGAIALGASVYMIKREYFSVPVKLMDFLAQNKVTVCVWAVSAMCFVSVMGGFEYRVPTSIRKVIFSGEPMPPKQLRIWQRALPPAQFANVYGPTEITCNCTYYFVDSEFSDDMTIPMGKPFENEKVFLLSSKNERISSSNVVGELCVAGDCLALGYYNDLQKTAESFVANPLQKAYPETIYRTGDLAFYDANGDLVYAGRKDFQIKHMGQRIELGEIQSAALSRPDVQQAACVYDTQKKRIYLFYVGSCSKDVLYEHLKELLPNYMVPNKIMQLSHMPLTEHGKTDRQALIAYASKKK